MKKIQNAMMKAEINLSMKARHACRQFGRALSGNEGAMYVDEGGTMLIAVVVGMLLLVGIYALFNSNGGIISNITDKTQSMFNYAG